MTYPQFPMGFVPAMMQPMVQQPVAQPMVQQPVAQPMAPAYAPAMAGPQYMQQPAAPQYAQQPAQGYVPVLGNPFAQQPAAPQFAQPAQAPQGQPPAAQASTNPFAMFQPAQAPAQQLAQQPAGPQFVAPTQQGAAPAQQLAQQPAVGQGGAAAGQGGADALQAQINDLRSQQAAWHVRTQLTQLAGEMGAINPEIVHKLVSEHFRANDAGQLMVASDPRMNPKEALAAFLHANQYLLRPLVPGGGSGAAMPTAGGAQQQVDPRTAQGATVLAQSVMAQALGMRPQPQPAQPPQYAPQGYAPQYAPQGFAPQYAPQPQPQPFGQPSQAAQFPFHPVR